MHLQAPAIKVGARTKATCHCSFASEDVNDVQVLSRVSLLGPKLLEYQPTSDGIVLYIIFKLDS